MQKTFTISLISLLLSAFLSPFYAQQNKKEGFSISGIIKDENGYHVEGAEIILSNVAQQKNTQTDSAGTYRLKNLPAGIYLLEINNGEYIDHHQVAIKGKDLKHNIVLNNSKYELGEVHLKVESVKSEIEKKGFAVNVIETEEAGLRNIQTNELLNQTVGIKIRQNGGLGSAVDYNLNGMSGNSVKIFIDGIPASTYGSSFDLNSISPAMIKRIEVYKGVVPGYLADDALGGAINVILKKDVQNHINASISHGSFNTTQANFNATYRGDSGFFVRASGFYNHSDNDYEVWGKFVRNILPNGRYDYVRAKRFNDAYKSYGGVVETGISDVSWADNFSIGYTGSSSYNEIQHGAFMSVPYKGRFMEADAGVLNLTYNKSNFLIDGLELNFHSLYSNRKRTINDTVKWNYNWFGEKSLDLDGNPILRPDGAQQAAPTIMNIDREILSFRAGISYELAKNQHIILNHMFYDIAREEDDEIRSGLQRNFIGTRDLQKNVSSFSYEGKWFDEKLKTTLFGKYYRQDIIKMDPAVEKQNGEQVRIEEYFSNQTSSHGYGLAVSYLLSPAVTLLGSAEKAIRLPSENEVFGDIGENIVENPGINPEKSHNYNLGFKIGPYQWKEHKVSLSTSGFIRDTQDKIVRQTQSNLNDAIQTAPFENLGRTKSIGFDAELNYTFREKFNLLVNLSKFNTRFNNKYDNNGNVLSIYNVQIPSEPFLTANVNARYSFDNIIQKGSQLDLFYNFSYVDSFYNIWVPRKVNGIDQFLVPAQFIQDVGLSYAFPQRNLVLSFDVKNIFNKQAYDNFAVQKPGRAFYLKLNYSLNNFLN